MSPAPEIIRWVDGLIAQQDYLWFLALLAWTAVLAARLDGARRKNVPDWFVALAVTQILGAVSELVLLAQDIATPYTLFDWCMAVFSAAGASSLWLYDPGEPSANVRWRQGGAILVAGAFVIVRHYHPVAGGAAIGLLAAIGAWRIVRIGGVSADKALGLAVSGVAAGQLFATHGPWAHLLGAGRIDTDMSRFALSAASLMLISGLFAAVAVWRETWRTTAEGHVAGGRDLRRMVWLLLGWLVIGGLLIVWQGRQARRSFEHNFLQRVTTTATLLDPVVLQKCLGPELRVTSTIWKSYEDGTPVLVATIPHTRLPEAEALRSQLRRVYEKNSDIRYLYIAVVRGGMLLSAASSGESALEQGRGVVFRPFETADLDRLASRIGFFEGPFHSGAWGAVFSAKAPLFGNGGHPLGWLVADVSATTWTASFSQARLQGMMLVALGVAFWLLALAYRQRREERAAADQRAVSAIAADRLKSAFLAKVSHELRTPLQSLLGYSEILSAARLDVSSAKHLLTIRNQAEHMLRMVSDLIDLGAVQAGVFRLRAQPTCLSALFAECYTAVYPAAVAKGLRITQSVADDFPPWVNIDAARLRQILLNLLGNAVKFTPAGEVGLMARLVNIAGIPTAEIVVEDTGPGIPLVKHAQLFQPFSELAAGPGAGAGLGLAVVDAICRSMGGSIVLEVIPSGARFVVRLPLECCAAPDILPVPAAGISPLRSLRILLVEDNTLVRELLATFLTENGAQVQIARDGVSALELAAKTRPDVILLDIGLPGMDGLAVTRALRRDPQLRDIRLVGLSAHAQDVDAVSALSAGMNAFLPKPVSLARLTAVITATTAIEPAVEPQSSPALRQRLEQCFQVETPLVLAELRLAVRDRRWDLARQRVHYLKNSADVLGLTALQRACAEFCNTRWETKASTVDHAVDRLESLTSTEAPSDHRHN